MDVFVSPTPDDARHDQDRGQERDLLPVAILDQNKQLPPLDLGEPKRDSTAFDALRPRLIRLQALAAKCADTQVALGSDILGELRRLPAAQDLRQGRTT